MYCVEPGCPNPADRERLEGMMSAGSVDDYHDPEGYEVVELVCHAHEYAG